MKRINYLLAMVLTLTLGACSSDDESSSDDDKAAKLEVKELSLCDCMTKSIDLVMKNKGDMSKLQNMDYADMPELKSCERFEDELNGTDPSKAMAMMQECPEVMSKIMEMSQNIDMSQMADDLKEAGVDMDLSEETKNSEDLSDECNEYLKTFEQSMIDLQSIMSELKNNPTDTDLQTKYSDSVSKFGEMTSDVGLECAQSETFQDRMDEISERYADK